MKKKTTIKYVRRAGMWCITTWKDGKQKQEWSVNKPAQGREVTDHE